MVALVVVVAGSLLTLVAVRLDEVSASAVTERVDDSDAFLHDSILSLFGGTPTAPCGLSVADDVEWDGTPAYNCEWGDNPW